MPRPSLPLPNILQGPGGARRLLLIGAVAAVVGGVWWVGHWASTPTYVTLYRDLEFSEAGSIQDALAKTGIPHRLSPDGTQVLVPVSDIARARVALAKDGLPKDGRPGLELFDKPAWGMTDFAQRVTYQRALEGELARTVGGIQGVERARVHLVLATQSALRKLERPATASVVLTLRAGAVLEPATVQGITYVVSNSVENLASEDVAVMDESGRVLSIPSGHGSVAGKTSWQIETQRSMEQGLSEKVEGLLATVVGAGRVRAQVAAILDFDEIDSTTEIFDPDAQVLATEQRSEGSSASGDDASGGQVVVSNSYQNSKRTERSTRSAGRLTRLTVAVLVDEKAMEDAKTRGDNTLTVERLEAMVSDAVGADPSRGDRVSLLAVPFEPVAVPDEKTGTASSVKPKLDPLQMVERVGRPLSGVLAIIALLLLGMRVLRASPVAPAAPSGPPVEAASEAAEPAVLARRNALPGGRSPSSKPEATTRVMRAWLAEN